MLAILMALLVVLSLGFPVQALNNNDANSRIVIDNTIKDEIKGEHIPGQVIIKLNEGVSLDDSFMDKHQLKSAEKVLKADSKKNKKADKVMKSRGLDRIYLAEVSSEEKLLGVLEKLNKDSRVEYAEPDYVLSIDAIPNDLNFSKLYGLHNTGQTGGTVDADIDAPEAWNIQTGSSDIIIAVIDTGVDYNHPDLTENIWVNLGEISGNGIDDDNNSFVDDIHGYDFCNNDGNPIDDHNHGTHCAGTIGAVGNNGVGVVGVNWNASIMPIKAFSAGGSGTTANCIAAIEYATMMNADVMSNSWGGGGYSQALYDAISAADDAGILFVAAAGNSGSNNDLSPHYPSSYDVPNVIAVAATDHNDNKASFSCYGHASVDLGAPGVGIYSTVIGGYDTYSGTSMACPHVAGVAGLIKAEYSDFSSDEIKERLLSRVDPIPSLDGKTVTGGRLNVYNSLENDNISPSNITDLAIVDTEYSSVSLTWIAVGDDGLSGTASIYDIRYSTSEITDTSWDSATQAIEEPLPNPSGFTESFTVKNLEFGTTYYFAIKAVDNVGNIAGLSNIVSESTTISTIAFSDDMESGLGWTFDGLWHHETFRSNSPVSSLAYNTGYPYYTYNTGTSNFGSLTSPIIDLSNFTSAILAFEYLYQTESAGTYWDKRFVQIGVDGVFTDIVQLSGDPMIQWNDYIIDISSYAGNSNVQVRFFFNTIDNVSNNFEGWYIDDMLIFGESFEENILPVADAGSDQTVSDADGNGAETITLNGSESYDPDGELVSFKWYQVSTFLGDGSLLDYDFLVGTHNVTLIVKDEDGAVGIDEVVITVNPNQSPIANAGPDQSSFVGTVTNFDGSESFDSDGEIVSYEWNFSDGTTGSGVSPTHIYDSVGDFTVILTIMDNGEATATDTASVKVIATDIVEITKAQYDSKKHKIIFQAASSGGGEAVLEVFRTSDNFSYGQMVYNIDRNLFMLTVYNIDSNPGTITIKSSLGGGDIKIVTNKFKK